MGGEGGLVAFVSAGAVSAGFNEWPRLVALADAAGGEVSVAGEASPASPLFSSKVVGAPFSAVLVLLTLTPPTSPSLPFFRFLGPAAHDSFTSSFAPSTPASPPLPPPAAAAAAASLSPCCRRRNSSSWSRVSLRTSASFARVDSITESKNSTSSSSRLRNWLRSRFCSSKASCFAAPCP